MDEQKGDAFARGLDELRTKYKITSVNPDNLDSIEDPQIREFVRRVISQGEKDNISSEEKIKDQ